MLVENFTTKELHRFREKITDRFYTMYNKWLYSEIKRMGIQQSRSANKISKVFPMTVDRQKCHIHITCSSRKKLVWVSIETHIETPRGKIKMFFYPNDDSINITTPHYNKRLSERIDDSFLCIENQKVCPYLRHGRVYQLIVNRDAVQVAIDMGDKVLKYITVLHKDMCTGKHYQNLFERLESNLDDSLLNNTIDAASMYEWE